MRGKYVAIITIGEVKKEEEEEQELVMWGKRGEM